MGSDTAGAKPSVRITEKQGNRILGVLIVYLCKSMGMAFWQSVRIIVDVRKTEF